MSRQPSPLPDPVGKLIEEWHSAYQARTPRSAAAFAAAMRHVPEGTSRATTYYDPYPLCFVRGEGCWVWDADGNRYLDMLNNYTSLVHGHAHPESTAAICDQSRLGTVFAGVCEAQIEMADLLCARIPSLERVRFCNSGSEATQVAMRAARAHTGRPAIARIDGSYHGTHDVAAVGAATERVESTTGVARSVRQDVLFLPYNDPTQTEQIIVREKDRLAGVIVEPALGAAGVIPATRVYLETLRRVTEQHGIVLIFDEVQTLRLAPAGVQGLFGITPDLTALGKLIGGGLPVGAVGGKAEIMNLFGPGGPLPHGGTFNGNSATMAAGLATLKALTGERIEAINRQGDRARHGIATVFAAQGIRAQVTGTGSLMNIHFTSEPVVDGPSAKRANKQLSDYLHLLLLSGGVLSAKRGMYNISTAMNAAEIDLFLAKFQQALATLKPAVSALAPALAS